MRLAVRIDVVHAVAAVRAVLAFLRRPVFEDGRVGLLGHELVVEPFQGRVEA